MMGWQWHQLDHMQVIYTSLQTDNHTSTSPLSFYRPDAVPPAQPTASKHRRHYYCRNSKRIRSYSIINVKRILLLVNMPDTKARALSEDGVRLSVPSPHARSSETVRFRAVITIACYTIRYAIITCAQKLADTG